ncbi:MAG: hypothetical protein J0H69_10455 [Burkholderiales bacterium]|nr:hypothetical protein [Burkholderiales bacterium]
MSDDRPDASPLRDARLVRALEHAPDAHLRPDGAVRAAVLSAAREAVAPPAAPVRPGWRAWFGGGRGAGMPWNAAFATLLVAGFVTLLWQGEPVPEARLDTPPPPAAPAAAPAEVPAAPGAASPAPAPAPAPVLRPAPPSAAERAREMREAEASRQRRAEAPAMPAAPPAAAPAPAPARPSGDVAGAVGASGAAPAVAESASPASPPSPATPAPAVVAPAPAPAATARSAAPMAAQRLMAEAALPGDWTHVRIAQPGGGVVALDRSAAGSLPDLLRALRPSADAPGVAADAAAPAQRIELRRGDALLGTLELQADRWRYQPLAGDVPARMGRLDAAAAAAWRAELARLGAPR